MRTEERIGGKRKGGKVGGEEYYPVISGNFNINTFILYEASYRICIGQINEQTWAETDDAARWLR